MLEAKLDFRNNVFDTTKLAFGCSHTYGIGVEVDEAWPSLLAAMNFGVPGCSADLISRILPTVVNDSRPYTIFILWPDWTRFEIFQNNKWQQSLPSDKDRINFMASHDEQWLKNNFAEQVQKVRNYCDINSLKLVDMTLYDLIPHIDHADHWPLSKFGHHYGPQWHQWVADIFDRADKENFKFPLAYE